VSAREPRSNTNRSLIDEWEQFQTETVLAAAKELEQNYFLLLEDPPIDRVTKKPIQITPQNSINYSPNAGAYDPETEPAMHRPQTPAAGAFVRHENATGGGGLVGWVSEDQARMRIKFADTRIDASWALFTLPREERGANGPIKVGSYPTFTDVVGDSPRGTAARKQVFALVERALASDDKRIKTTIDGWSAETRPFAFFDKCCMTCHRDAKLGDLAAISVYLTRPRAKAE
jgi:hypothetical protein